MRCFLLSIAFAGAVISCRPVDIDKYFHVYDVDSVFTFGQNEAACHVGIRLHYAVNRKHDFRDNVNRDLLDLVFGPDRISLNESVSDFMELQQSNFNMDNISQLRLSLESGTAVHYSDCEVLIESSLRTSCPDGVVGIDIRRKDTRNGGEVEQMLLCRNYSTRDGHLITLREVFEDGYEEHLMSVLEDKLLEYAGCENRDQLDDVGYSSDMEMFIPDNFCLGKDSIVFVFNGNDIAPQSAGITRLAASHRELRTILK